MSPGRGSDSASGGLWLSFSCELLFGELRWEGWIWIVLLLLVFSWVGSNGCRGSCCVDVG